MWRWENKSQSSLPVRRGLEHLWDFRESMGEWDWKLERVTKGQGIVDLRRRSPSSCFFLRRLFKDGVLTWSGGGDFSLLLVKRSPVDICARPVRRSWPIWTGWQVGLSVPGKQLKQVSCDLYLRELSSIEAVIHPYDVLHGLPLLGSRQLESLLFKKTDSRLYFEQEFSPFSLWQAFYAI